MGVGFIVGAALASSDMGLPGTDYVDTIEYNVYGEKPNVKCAVLFRDVSGSIIDWRYCALVGEPVKLSDGSYMLTWMDPANPPRQPSPILRTVYARKLIDTRTKLDKELEERKILPENLRKKLWQPSPTPVIAPIPTPTPGVAPMPAAGELLPPPRTPMFTPLPPSSSPAPIPPVEAPSPTPF